MEIARYIAENRLPLVQGYAGRTHPADIEAICEIAQQASVHVDAYLFIGVSPIRQYVEDWDLASIQRHVRASAVACRREGVEFVLVLEDAVRCTPEVLAGVYDAAIESGVARLTLCDTVGAALPAGAASLIHWSRRYFLDRGHPVAFEWHGHNDRGLALANSLTALALGCERVHGTILGIGERAGNASLDQLVVNTHLDRHDSYDLKALRDYCDYAAPVLGVDIPQNYPALGRDVFKTSAGVHASAILKAHEKETSSSRTACTPASRRASWAGNKRCSSTRRPAPTTSSTGSPSTVTTAPTPPTSRRCWRWRSPPAAPSPTSR